MAEIAGYRELNQEELSLINSVKAKGEELDAIIESLRDRNYFDQRWVAIGQTHLQQGLMALTRAIARPTNF